VSLVAEGEAGRAARPFIISFSHFVPRQELLPEKRMLFLGDLHKLSGSTHLEAQVRGDVFIRLFVYESLSLCLYSYVCI